MSFSPIILRYDSLPSTNTEAARQAAAGAAEGLCIVAREQTAGRGRRERVWASPRDAGLYFSLVLRPPFTHARWPLITLMSALAAADAIADACALIVDIKWPNDLLASDGRKLCGILAETVETEGGRACVVGIGINLDNRAFPPELQETATSIEAHTGSAPQAEQLLTSLVKSLAHRYAQLQEQDGAARIVFEWEARSSFARGRRIRVRLAEDWFDGTTRGLEPDGALRVETDLGESRIVRAGDVVALRQTTLEAETLRSHKDERREETRCERREAEA